jgi:hypothetical protein
MSTYVPPVQVPQPSGTYTPQLSDGEMASIISHNQPWKDRDEIFWDVYHEQLRQRLWNGHGR